MSSIVPGFEYDIFISYRHNDNRSGWVTEFVNALQEELAATIKEPVTVYFDKNAHDGLLETHNVDKSLEGKLKCLIFIPIISQTYCDPKSFAWQHEFCAFDKLAKADLVGRDIKLNNGNVASRILPIKIHDLDIEDKLLLENELGGVLRAVEFIFKSTGVNRPLHSSEDHPQDNLNKTFYRDQVNKVANAIKEIITVLKRPVGQPASAEHLHDEWQGGHHPKNFRRLKKRLAVVTFILLLSALVYFTLTTNLFSWGEYGELEKSIAVLAFDDMSPNHDQTHFSDGISEELINALAKMPNLKVTGRTSSFFYKGKNEMLHVIGKELGVSTILEGSVRKSGNTLRITAQLINTKNGFHLWTATYNRELTDIFKIQDEITEAILKELKMHLENGQEKSSTSPVIKLDAYETYMRARQKLAMRGKNLYDARDLFEKVIELDPNYSPAYSGLGLSLALIPAYFPVPSKEFNEQAKSLAQKAMVLNPINAEAYSVMGCVLAFYEWSWVEAESYFQRSFELNPNDTEVLNFLGDFYTYTWHPRAAEIESKALALDPLHPIKYNDLGRTYCFLRHWDKAIDAEQNSLRLDPTLFAPLRNLVEAQCQLGHFEEAERLVNAYSISDRRNEIGELELKTQIAIEKGDFKNALTMLSQLEIATGKGEFYPAQLATFFIKINMNDKAAFWFEKTYQQRDFFLIADYMITLPENLPNHAALRKAFDKPELNALFELRRKNSKLDLRAQDN